MEEMTADGDTALTLASQAGHVENVKVLLQHGASPHNTNSKNESPLLLGNNNTKETSNKSSLLQAIKQISFLRLN